MASVAEPTAESAVKDDTVKKAGAAYVGSAIGGSLLGGVPFTDVATSFQGAPGVLCGYVAGTFLSPVLPDGFADYADWMPIIGALVVPLLAGGTVDRALFGLVAGAKIGSMIV